MREIAVYHNPDSMGYPASEVTDAVVVTDKPVGRDAIGSRIWLLTGEGQPRRFLLRGYFTVSEVERGDEDGFRTRVLGVNEKFFNPMIELNAEEWFRDFQRSQGNFAFGFQSITDSRFIEGLEAAVDAQSPPAV